MPRGDRTGPKGMGPRTGRGLGYCSGYNWAGAAQAGPGWGAGFGFGRGRGWRHWARATGLPGWLRGGVGPNWMPDVWGTSPAPQDEAAMLNAQAEQLQEQLDVIQQRLNELQDQ